MKQQNSLLFIVIMLSIIGYVLYRNKLKTNKYVYQTDPDLASVNLTNQAPKTAANNPAVPRKSTSGATGFPLRNGSKGKAVKLVQILVGANPVDGAWGPQTGAKVKQLLNVTEISEELFGRLCAKPNTYEEAAYFPLKRGSNNNYSKALQVLLDVKVGTLGIFGDITATALNNYMGVEECSAASFTKIVNNVLRTNF